MPGIKSLTGTHARWSTASRTAGSASPSQKSDSCQESAGADLASVHDFVLTTLAVYWTGEPDGSRPGLRRRLLGATHDLGTGGSALFLIAWPRPAWYLAQWMEFAVALGVRILHRHLRPEFHVLAHGFAKFGIGGHGGDVEGSQVQLDEPLALFFGDMETPVHIDEMLETQLPAEAVRTAEGLGGEGREVVNVLRLAATEERTEDRIRQDTSIEGVLQSVQALLATRVLVEGGHHPRLPAPVVAPDQLVVPVRRLSPAPRARLPGRLLAPDPGATP